MDDPEFGRFEGSVQTDWTDSDREMILLADFAYWDPADFRWNAPAWL